MEGEKAVMLREIGERLGKFDASRTAALEAEVHKTGVAMAAANAGTAEIARDFAPSIRRREYGDPRRRAELRHGLFRHGQNGSRR